MIALDVGGHADLVDDLGDHHLEVHLTVPALAGEVHRMLVARHLDDAFRHHLHVERLQEMIDRTGGGQLPLEHLVVAGGHRHEEGRVGQVARGDLLHHPDRVQIVHERCV